MASVFVIISLIILSHCKVEGISTNNDPVDITLSITTTNGEIYDCVDFYKQPAFSNPFLKNLTDAKALRTEPLARAHARKAPMGMGLRDGGCPFGTVPILRTKRERENDHYAISHEIITPQDDPHEHDHCYAIVRTNVPDSRYLGVSGVVAIYNPVIHDGPQWSAARMRLSNGDESMEVGWMVNRGIFSDTKTHLYIRFIAGGKGCFNLQCSGFVQVAKDVPIGLVPDNISERGGMQYTWQLSIDKHKDDGNWWLSIQPEKYGIGYWPKTLFSSLADVANQVEWGGEVYDPSRKSLAPEMGCGFKPNYDTRLADFISNAEVVDVNFHSGTPPRSTVTYQNCMSLYEVEDSGYTGQKYGRIILFGGPHD